MSNYLFSFIFLLISAFFAPALLADETEIAGSHQQMNPETGTDMHIKVLLDEIEWLLEEVDDDKKAAYLRALQAFVDAHPEYDMKDPYHQYLTGIFTNLLVFSGFTTIVLSPFVCLSLCAASTKVLFFQKPKVHAD